jgi:hypothetical protein
MINERMEAVDNLAAKDRSMSKADRAAFLLNEMRCVDSCSISSASQRSALSAWRRSQETGLAIRHWSA